ncbi:MAG: hypothetical protein HYY40_02065 [Bacteroidetes bacterium]|nr:hypothetical protein [Bacteroidota bacterium]
MKKNNTGSLIIRLVKERALVKQEVQEAVPHLFNELKLSISDVTAAIKTKTEKFEKKVPVEIEEKSEFQVNLRIGEDVLIFVLHSNIFSFDSDHHLWKTSYLEEDPARSFCSMIYVYNFLHDSFRYNRINDTGYLIARIFINKERHFFVEGKRQLGMLYNDFSNAIADRASLAKVVESAILYALDFDIFVPPYEEVKQISVQEMQDITVNMRIKTAKRMGFQFRIDENRIE